MEVEFENENKFGSVELDNSSEDKEHKGQAQIIEKNLFKEIDQSRENLRVFIEKNNTQEISQKIQKHQNKMKSVISILTLIK